MGIRMGRKGVFMTFEFKKDSIIILVIYSIY
jgi:hypothetical protein